MWVFVHSDNNFIKAVGQKVMRDTGFADGIELSQKSVRTEKLDIKLHDRFLWSHLFCEMLRLYTQPHGVLKISLQAFGHTAN